MPKARSLATIFQARRTASKLKKPSSGNVALRELPDATVAGDDAVLRAKPSSTTVAKRKRKYTSSSVEIDAAHSARSGARSLHSSDAAPTESLKRQRFDYNVEPNKFQQGSDGQHARTPLHQSLTDDKSAPLRGWHCASMVDQQAAVALHRLLQADELKSNGATLKALTLAPHIQNKQATFAVTCETLKHLPVLRKLLDGVHLLQKHPKLGFATAAVLIYELLFGKGLGRAKAAEKAVLEHKEELEHGLKTLLAEGMVQNVSSLLHQVDAAPSSKWPRSVRVNTLKTSVSAAMAALAASRGGPRVTQDELLPDVLLLPPGTDLHDHPWVASGQLVLQSKASCLPAHALHPRPNWTVLDCCAAPGNKTTHVAALLKGRGKVLALDRDAKRLKRLQENVALLGATNVHAQHMDFLSIDPLDEQFAEVQGVILDPSCSGSGTVFSRMDHLLPSHESGAALPR